MIVRFFHRDLFSPYCWQLSVTSTKMHTGNYLTVFFMYYTPPQFLSWINLLHNPEIKAFIAATVWILIRQLHLKPADLDLQCFQKRINLGSAGQLRFMSWEAQNIKTDTRHPNKKLNGLVNNLEMHVPKQIAQQRCSQLIKVYPAFHTCY